MARIDIEKKLSEILFRRGYVLTYNEVEPSSENELGSCLFQWRRKKRVTMSHHLLRKLSNYAIISKLSTLSSREEVYVWIPLSHFLSLFSQAYWLTTFADGLTENTTANSNGLVSRKWQEPDGSCSFHRVRFFVRIWPLSRGSCLLYRISDFLSRFFGIFWKLIHGQSTPSGYLAVFYVDRATAIFAMNNTIVYTVAYKVSALRTLLWLRGTSRLWDIFI